MQRVEERTISYADALSRTYALGFTILAGDAEKAEKVVVESVNEVKVSWGKQKHRGYYKGLRNRAPNKATVSRPSLLQHIVCDKTLRYEEAQESAFLLGQGSLDERTLLLRFIKHLLHESRNQSFNVAVGICRVLHKYDHATTKRIYGVLDQRDQDHLVEGGFGNKLDDKYRQCKKKLLDKLEQRFEHFVSIDHVQRNEKRFKSNARSSEWYGFVRDCLSLMTPWGTEHILPPEFEARKFNIAGLRFDGERCDDWWHLVEENRMHTITDPECFARVVKACKASEPEQQVDLPQFKGVGEGEGGGPADRLDKPPDLSSEQFRNISNELEHMGHRRKAAFEPSLTVEVDGVVRGRLNTAEASDLRLELSPDSNRIQVFTTDDEGKLLLASLWMSFLCVAPGEGWSSSLTLEGGQKLGITFVPYAPGAASGNYVINLSYWEGNWPRLLTRRCSRLGSRLAERARLYPLPRPGAFAVRMAHYGVPALLLCVFALAAPFQEAYHYLTMRPKAPMSEKFSAGGAPPAAYESKAYDLTSLSALFKGGKVERTGLKEVYRIWLSPRAQGLRVKDFRAGETADTGLFRFFLQDAWAPASLEGLRVAGGHKHLLFLFEDHLRSETSFERPKFAFGYPRGSLIPHGPGGEMTWRVPAARDYAEWSLALVGPPAAGVGFPLTASNAANFSPFYHALPPALKIGMRPDGDLTFVPRVGLVYSTSPRTELMGGYGVAYIPQDRLAGTNAWESFKLPSRVTFDGAERTVGAEQNAGDYFFPRGTGDKGVGRTASNLIRHNFQFSGGYHFDDIPHQYFRPSVTLNLALVIESFNVFNSPRSAPVENTRLVALAGHFPLSEDDVTTSRDYQKVRQLPSGIFRQVDTRFADLPAMMSDLETLRAHRAARPADRRETDGAKPNGADVFPSYTFSRTIAADGSVTDTSVNQPNRQPIVSLKANNSTVWVAVMCPPELTPDNSCEPTSTSVQLSAKAADPDGDRLLSHWAVTGGRIKGDGMKATWDLSEVPPGTYSSSIEVDDGRGAVVRSTVSVKVVRCGCLSQSACAPVRTDDGTGRYPRGHGLELWQEMQRQMG